MSGARALVLAALAAAAPARADVDPATFTAVKQLLLDLDARVRARDEAWLAAHVRLPLPTRDVVYDMEVKLRPSSVKTAKQLLQRKTLTLPPGFVAALRRARTAADVKQGAARCEDGHDEIDFHRGPPAIRVDGDEVTVTFVALACGAEDHATALSLDHLQIVAKNDRR